MSWLSGWQYRKTVTITGEAGAGTDYQVDFSIGEAAGGDFNIESHCTSFPNDIQVTDNDQTTPLDYWVEDLTVDPISMWIKVADDLGSNADICIYYGSGESSASNGEATFDFFDDFETDLSKWPNSIGTPVLSTTQKRTGAKSVYFTPSQAIKMRRDAEILSGKELSWYFYDGGETTNLWQLGGVLSVQHYIGINVSTTTTHYTIYDRSIPGYVATTVARSNGWRKASIRTDSDIRLYIDDVLVRTIAGTTTTGIQIGDWTSSSSANKYVDDCYVRKYQTNEPAFLSAGAEESAPSEFVPYPLFSGMDGGISEALCGGIAR